MNIPQVLNFCPAIFNPDLFELLLPCQSCPICVSFKWYHWVLNIHILGRRDRGRRIRMAGTLILVIPITLERLPISIECKPTLHHLLVLRVLGSLEITHRTLAAVLCDAEDPCSVNTAHEPESSFTVSPRCTTRPLYVWNFLSNL